MTRQSQQAYDDILKFMGNRVEKLEGLDYYELLEELSGHLDSLMDCYKEEHPGDFE